MPQQNTTQRAAEIAARWQKKLEERQQADLLSHDPVEVEMPSGDVVLAIRANLLSLLEAGRIPDGLTPFVLDLMKTPALEVQESIPSKIEHHWDEYSRMLDNVWISCVVSPPTTSARIPDPGQVWVGKIDLNDKIALFNWAQGVSDHLAAFRDPEAGTLRIVVDESGVSRVDGRTAPRAEPGEAVVAVLADQPSGDDVRPVGGRAKARNDRGRGRPAKARQANETQA